METKIKMMSRILILPLFFFLVLVVTSCYVSKDPQRAQTKKLQKGIIKDDSSYVYRLPYEPGESHLLVQGYFSRYSHRNRAALDFKMKRGTKICAVRGGVVIRVKEDGDKGGWNRKYRPEGNVVVIQHEDSSRAGYWHLQLNGALVNVGDIVEQGQVIGLSGKTGYTLFPHLHFISWKSNRGQWRQVATRFQTNKGILYLRPFRKYRNTNQTN
ncbi:MAG TPA: M23 family metallopeptidase [Ferruginibacter sp.]|nr:M23 family metallopeptidase [Ferruginibacter sp.]